MQVRDGVKAGLLFQGSLRVNPRCRSEGYITLLGLPCDIFVEGPLQNRAVEGDKVAFFVWPASEWKGKGAAKSDVEEAEGLGLGPRLPAPVIALAADLGLPFKPEGAGMAWLAAAARRAFEEVTGGLDAAADRRLAR